jgi:hypothetical protein
LRTMEVIGARVAALLFAAFCLSGCAGARLYSDSRDGQGKAAQAAWQKVDLNKIVATERGNLNQVLQVQLDTQDKLAAAIRNNTLRALVERDLNSGLVASIDENLEKLVGDNPADAIRGSRDAMRTYDEALTNQETDHRIFRRIGLPVPSCEALNDPSKPLIAIEKYKQSATAIQVADIDEAVKSVKQACADPISKKYAAVFAGLKGQMEIAVDQQAANEAKLAKLRSKSQGFRTEYQEKLKAYNDAVAAAGASDPKAAAPTAAGTPDTGACPDGPKTGGDAAVKAGEAGKRLCQIVALIDNANDAFSTAFISKERLDALDKFVSTVTKASADGKLPDDASEAAKAFILLPQLMDDAKKSLAEAKKPLILPLMIRRNMEQLKLDGANKEIAILEARGQLSSALVDTLYAQAVQMWRAKEALASDGSNGSVDMRTVLPLKMVDAFAKASPDQREILYHSVSMYSDALNRLGAKRYRLEYQRLATYQEVSLSYAEVNLKQWSTLIGGSVDQVAESASLGIKPETISALLNTIGTFYIGYGVNK